VSGLVRVPAQDGDRSSNDVCVSLDAGWACGADGTKRDGDWEKYDRCVRLADELFGRATPDLENALKVSYLEHLDFDGPRGPKAWECMTPRLKVGWKEMQQYLQDLAARGTPGLSR
jgi:hypothetical protein